MVLPTVERIVAATEGHGLEKFVSELRKWVNGDDTVVFHRSVVRKAFLRAEDPTVCVKRAGEHLRAISRTGTAQRPDNIDAPGVLNEARNVYREIARRQGADRVQAAEIEHQRQVADIVAVSPPLALKH
ncbi:hypothetical protein [Sinorhizobium fredii]|nr:hypothetical protein [Sinorhizobium fredii]